MKDKTTIITRGNIKDILREVEDAVDDIVPNTEWCPKLIITIEKEED